MFYTFSVNIFSYSQSAKFFQFGRFQPHCPHRPIFFNHTNHLNQINHSSDNFSIRQNTIVPKVPTVPFSLLHFMFYILHWILNILHFFLFLCEPLCLLCVPLCNFFFTFIFFFNPTNHLNHTNHSSDNFSPKKSPHLRRLFLLSVSEDLQFKHLNLFRIPNYYMLRFTMAFPFCQENSSVYFFHNI